MNTPRENSLIALEGATPQETLYQQWRHESDFEPMVESFDAFKKNEIKLEGVCGNCGLENVLVCLPLKIVSKQFANWAPTIVKSEKPIGWCETCAWCYWWKPLRGKALLINSSAKENTPSSEYGNGRVNWDASKNVLREKLTQSLSASETMVVPHMKNKHLVPHAQWGWITADAGTFPWTEREAKQFVSALQLGESGVRVKCLKDRTPPASLVVNATTIEQYEEAIKEWDLARNLVNHPLWNVFEWLLQKPKGQ